MNNRPTIRIPASGCLILAIIFCAAIWYFGVPSLILSFSAVISLVFSIALFPKVGKRCNQSIWNYYWPCVLFAGLTSAFVWAILKINY